MPANRLRSSLLKPLVVLAIPGMYLVYKYNQFKRQQQENSRRKVTEKELEHLNHKIDKLLAKLDEHEGSDDPKISEEEECVVCLCAKATMQTFPCGHRVVCRKCFVKTIQVAVSQRCLPLRCVVCRTRILKLRQTSEEPLTPQLPRKQNALAGGFHTPTFGPKVPKHSSSLRQFFSNGGGKQRSSSPTVAGRRVHSNGGPSTARQASAAAPVATKLMQPLLIYPSQTSPKQHRAFGSDFLQHATSSSSGAHSDLGLASSSHATSRHRTLNLNRHQQSTLSSPPSSSSSSSAMAAASSSASSAAAAAAAAGGDPFAVSSHGPSSAEGRPSSHAMSRHGAGPTFSQLVQSPRLARCSHCSPHIHPSPRPASVSRVAVKQRV